MKLGHAEAETDRTLQPGAVPMLGSVCILQGEEQVALEQCELGKEDVLLAAELDRPVDDLESLGRPAGER